MLHRVQNARGISLIEAMVALAILSTVLLSLTGLMWQMGRNARDSSAVTMRTGVMESAASLAYGVQWDSLPNIVGCSADTTAALISTICYEVQTLTAQVRQVRVIVAPTSPAGMLPDTITLRRAKERQVSPLKA